MPNPSISVCIPCYNSSESLPDLLRQLGDLLPTLAPDFEVIAVNDGSYDDTWDVLQKLATEYAWLKPLDLLRNYGQHNALLCAVRTATHPIIVTLDDDLQHPPDQIPLLLDKLDGCDVVYGYPEYEEQSAWRSAAATLTKVALSRFMGADIARRVGPFRAFRTELRDAFADYSGSFVSLDVLLTWASSRFGAVPTRHEPRTTGVSHYTFRKLATHALNMVTGFSILPLQIASVVGFAFCGLGVLLLLYVLSVQVISGTKVPGFTFLATSITLFSGVQLLALGVIGEYIARMHFQSMGKPSYAVRSSEEQAD